MKKISIKDVLKNKNIIKFKEDFVIAGPRISLFYLYDTLIKNGVWETSKDKFNLFKTNNTKCVLLCKNEGINSKFGTITVCDYLWWNWWYKNKKTRTKNSLRTFNYPKQVKEITEELVIEKIPTLKSE